MPASAASRSVLWAARTALRAVVVIALFCLTQCGKREDVGPKRNRADVQAWTQPNTQPVKKHPENTAPVDQARHRTAARESPGTRPAGFPSAPHKAREFVNLSDEEKKALDRLEEEFWQTKDESRRLEILDQIEASYYGREVLTLAEKILALGDETLGRQAVGLLAGNDSPDIIPILEKTLGDASETIRSDAATAAGQVRDDAVVGFLGKVFEDSSSDVALAGLRTIGDQTQTRKLKILARALQSTYSDVQTSAISDLQLESTPRSVEVLFSALDSPDPEVRDQARFSLDFMLDHEFQSAAAAQAWWETNKGRFDNDLVPKE
jgi:hypothetical protein